ncbi:T7SS effector LXG polymorphic toxin [Psychrobacillus sp. FSL K6-2843]|uniref:T7SS effector LXG polymorphic toxin n=1 Tax=Psychrobacillus sp. FSL K6-2843 TaxID=2921549 RepID=UPI00315ACCA8
MKILDVDLLQDGLKRNMAMLERLRTETENIERTVSGLVEMDELLKGEGGYAIRDFYAECHLPFLQFFQLFSDTYGQTLEQIESALQSLEPDSAGYIMQEFLEGELEQGLTLIGNLTEALTNEANSIMDSVSDIVSLPHLDDSAVQEGVITSKKKRDDTVQQLNEFDYSQTVSLNPVEQDIQTMDTWLTDIEGMYQSGLTDVHFQSPQWRVNPSRKRLVWELATRESVLPKLKKYALTEELSSMLQTYLEGVSPISFGLGGQISSPNVFIGPALNRMSTGNQFNLSHLKNNLIPSVEQLVSATEAETLISKAVDEKQVFDEYVSFPEVSTIQGKYYTLPDGRILRQYYGKTGAYEYKYVNSIPEDQLGDSKTLEDIFPAIKVMDEFLVGDIITMVENPSPGPIAEAALFTVVKPLKIIDKINDGFKDGKKIEKVDGKGTDKDNIFSNGSFNHVFHGEINKKSKAVGYHHESMMGGKIVEVTDPPNKYGVYRAIIEIEGKNKKVPSTFFPADWNRVQVADAIKQAYSNRQVLKDNLYEGILPNGMKIQMRLDPEGKIKTAYPIY